MNNIKSCTLVFLFVLIAFNALSQSKFPINVNIEMNKRDLHKIKDFNVEIRLSTSVNNNKFLFRRCFKYQYNKDTTNLFRNPDAIIILEKIVNGNYFTVPVDEKFYDLSMGACIDSLGREMFDTLSINNPLTYRNNIGPTFKLKKAKYRIRIKLNLPMLDDRQKKYIYSKWNYFNVSNSEIDYSDLNKQINGK